MSIDTYTNRYANIQCAEISCAEFLIFAIFYFSLAKFFVNFGWQFSVDFLWDYIWLLCNDIKDRRRWFWWSFSSPPRRALCFYHSIPGSWASSFSFSIFSFSKVGLPSSTKSQQKETLVGFHTNTPSFIFFFYFTAIVDSSVQPGPLLIGLIHQSGCFCLSIFKQCSYSVNHIYKAPLLMPREQWESCLQLLPVVYFLIVHHHYT